MKIEFLQTSQPGLRWIVQYDRNNPQLNEAKAFASFEATKQRMAELPPPRETFWGMQGVWEAKIQKSVFISLYNPWTDRLCDRCPRPTWREKC